MKVAVIGAGAIGSVVGGLLSKAGEDVTLIGRKPHVDAIRQRGLLLDGETGKTVIQVGAAESLNFRPDLVLLAVKTQDVECSVREVRSYLSGVPLLTMQNGVRSDDLVAGILGEENVVSSVVTFHSVFLEPGKVSFSNPTGKVDLLIGEPFAVNANRLQRLSALLNRALRTQMSEDIRGAHWTKLIWNLNNAVPAVTGLSIQENNRCPRIRELNIGLIREGLQVIESAGIKTAPVPGVPLSLIKTMVKMPLRVSSLVVKSKTRSLGKTPVLTSTLQSIRRGRSTEIDYLNGEIVNLGKQKDIPTPLNSLIVELVHQVETTGKFLTVDELTQRLGLGCSAVKT
jgi:2-dehydropantoate 2-reductase